MNGAEFLTFYTQLGIILAILIIALRIAGQFYLHRFKAQESPFIPYTQPTDPYDLAYLRSGRFGVVQQAFLGLVAKGYLVPESARVFRLLAQPGNSGLTSEEGALLNHYQVQPVVKFPSSGGAEQQVLDTLLIAREGNLLAQQLIVSPAVVARLERLARLRWLLALGYGGVGAWRIATSLLEGRFNVSFTLYMAVMGTPILLLLASIPVNWGSPATKRGGEALRNATLALQADSTLPGSSWDFDSRWLAVFGPGVLAATVLGGVAWALQPPVPVGDSDGWSDWDIGGSGGDSGDGGSGCGGCGGCS